MQESWHVCSLHFADFWKLLGPCSIRAIDGPQSSSHKPPGLLSACLFTDGHRGQWLIEWLAGEVEQRARWAQQYIRQQVHIQHAHTHTHTVNLVNLHAFVLGIHFLSFQFPEPYPRLYAADGVSSIPDQRTTQCQQQKPSGSRLWQHVTATHGFPGWKVSAKININLSFPPLRI